jgi:hypothetical protein
MAIGITVASFLAVVMKSTNPITWLHGVCESLFDKALFGVNETKLVLCEIHQQFIHLEQKQISPRGKYYGL